MSQICYDRFNRAYYCNRSGLAYGARIGIGIGIAVAVLALVLLISYFRRKSLQRQFAKYRPPVLPTSQGDNQYGGQYANNPPPPPGATGLSNWNSNQFGSNPPPPPQTYQPSMAGQYGAKGTRDESHATTNGVDDNEHGYEWEQAREEERLARGQAPPGYNVTGDHAADHTGYAPPTGPPPSTAGYAAPPGPPPTGAR